MNLLLAAGKITAGMLGHSFALVADGIESLSDTLSSLVVYFGLKLAVKPRDENHPYGHGKAEPLAALAVGIALATAVTIAIQSVREIASVTLSVNFCTGPRPSVQILTPLEEVDSMRFRVSGPYEQMLNGSCNPTSASNI